MQISMQIENEISFTGAMLITSSEYVCTDRERDTMKLSLMDELWFYVLLNNLLVITGRWVSHNEMQWNSVYD